MEKKKFVSLDFLRAISALIVAFGHIRFIMLVPSVEVTNMNYVNTVLYFLGGFGYEAVIVFFVLSGFFITRSIDNSVKRNAFSLEKYFTDRYFRLSVVAIPAVFLTLILDQSSFLLVGSESLYYERFDWMNEDSYTIKTFFSNLFHLQSLFEQYLGSNGPLWSLSYEWWFYVLGPFILIQFYGIKKYYLILFVIIGTLVFFANYKIIIYFFYWLFGSLAYYYSKKDWGKVVNSKWWLLIFVLLLLIASSITRLRMIDKIVGHGIMSINIAVLIFFLVKNDIIKDNKLIVFFTNISYSLYAIHLPVMIFLVSLVPYFNLKLQPTFLNTLLSMLVLGITIFISWLFYLVFEKNTNLIKNAFLKFVKR